MPTARFKTLVLGDNLTGTDNGDNTITIDATDTVGGGSSPDGHGRLDAADDRRLLRARARLGRRRLAHSDLHANLGRRRWLPDSQTIY